MFFITKLKIIKKLKLKNLKKNGIKNIKTSQFESKPKEESEKIILKEDDLIETSGVKIETENGEKK